MVVVIHRIGQHSLSHTHRCQEHVNELLQEHVNEQIKHGSSPAESRGEQVSLTPMMSAGTEVGREDTSNPELGGGVGMSSQGLALQ